MNKSGSYAIVTGSYWVFMLTDGALRMMVLLYFYKLGYSAVTLAFLFLFYEFFGMVTNLFGGWVAQRKGLKFTLLLGLSLQPAALISLSFLNQNWHTSLAIPFVMSIQALSGISKDFTKMSSKTAIKFLVPADKSSKLFNWVAILTGSKNAIKGFGFFTGGILLQTIGFQKGLWILSSLVVFVLIISLAFLPENIGETKNKMKLKNIFKQNESIKILSGSRIFLFASRDIWFVVALPVYFSSVFGWSHSQIGAFMASWVIGYGIIQSLAPSILKLWTGNRAPTGTTSLSISILLASIMVFICLLYGLNLAPLYVVPIGLIVFGSVFALNSSVHSYLVLHYAQGDKAAANVGFYYMANAGGRLVGTLLSGILFQWGGVLWALAGSSLFLITSTFITAKLPR